MKHEDGHGADGGEGRQSEPGGADEALLGGEAAEVAAFHTLAGPVYVAKVLQLAVTEPGKEHIVAKQETG